MSSTPTTRTRQRAALAATLLAAAALLPTSAGADYAPTIVIDGNIHWEGQPPHAAAPGAEINFGNDDLSGCAAEGVALEEATWSFGPPGNEHGTEVTTELLGGSVVPDEAGAWTATMTVPEDLTPGTYLLVGTCGPKEEPYLTYHGAFIEVRDQTTTSVVVTATTEVIPTAETSTVTPSTTAPPKPATGARPVRARASYTG